MLEWIAFGVFGLALLFSGRKVVTSHDLVHSVLWLGVMLVATAGLFVTLQAEFLAAVQILLYTGGVVTLMLFGIMLTRRLSSSHIEHGSSSRARGAVIAVLAFAVIAYGIVQGGDVANPGGQSPGDTKALGALVLTRLMLPFEVLSVLLLAAMIGAIVLARKVDQ